MANEPLKPHLWSIEDTFKHIYSVPVYQRPYSWDNEQVEVLMDDIFASYDLPEEKKQEGYFIGSIYIHDKNEKLKGLIEKYEIIDGQQRMTTIALVMLSLYSLAIKKQAPETDQTLLSLKQSLWKYIGRSYSKENRAITLNSIEKKSFSDLYDECFVNPKNIRNYCDTYKTNNNFEKKVFENFKYVYDRLNSRFEDKTLDDLLNFADYFLSFIQFIAIDSTCSINKAFTIFESINSKGKPLDEIDKIKTFIFSNLEEASYDKYLDLWGKLITETNDNLYDYLYTYIRAYISFYRQNIKIHNFKSLCKNEILKYYKQEKLSEALKNMLDDMEQKVKYYQMLESVDLAYSAVKNSEFRFFYKIFTKNNYQHPKPLFMRCLEEFNNKKITTQDLVEIIRETTKFMFEFLTISDRDSKDAITLFSTIMNDIYERGNIDKSIIVNLIANENISKGLTSEKIKFDIQNMDAYDQKKGISVALLSLYESTSIVDEKVKISYDQAYTLLNNYGTTFSLDHLLVQTPDIDSNFKYYCNEENRLVLKEGHDFNLPDVQQGMEYEQFKTVVLNKMGNLRIFYKDKNSQRQNDDAIQLKDYSGFTTYSKIKQRAKDIVDMLIDNCLPMPTYNPEIKLFSIIKENSLPKMNKLLEYGIVTKGDKVYLTVLGKIDSEAEIIDENHVSYQGKRMKFNEWGKELTGWKSIDIYEYTALSKDDESLQQKRIDFIQKEAETASN